MSQTAGACGSDRMEHTQVAYMFICIAIAKAVVLVVAVAACIQAAWSDYVLLMVSVLGIDTKIFAKILSAGPR